MADDVLMIYTVYERPADQPDPLLPFAVRGFEVRAGELVAGEAVWAASLDEARALVPARADHRLAREPGDEAQVVESWV